MMGARRGYFEVHQPALWQHANQDNMRSAVRVGAEKPAPADAAMAK
jgi:hypothetical protein